MGIKSWAQGQRKRSRERLTRFSLWIQGRPGWGKEQAKRAAGAVKRWAIASRQPIKGMLVLIAGLYFAGLPTYYAIFTVGHTDTTARHDRNLGLWLFLIWVLIALFAGYQTPDERS